MARQSKIKFGVFYKIFLTMLLGAIVPVAALSYLEYVGVRDRVQVDVEQSLSQHLEQTALLVDSWTDKTLRALNVAAELDGIRSMDPAQQTPILRTIANNYEWTYLVFTVAANGDNIARSDDADLKQYGDRIWFRQAMRGEDVGQQVLISRTNGKPAFSLSVPIKDDDGQPVGVMAMANFLTSVTDAVTRNTLGETGFAFLVDDQRRLIAHGGGGDLVSELQDYSTHPSWTGIRISDSDAYTYRSEDGEWIASQRTVGLGWTLVVQQDTKEAFAPLAEIQKRSAVVLLVAVALALVFSMILSRMLSNPIRQLTLIAEEFSRGNLAIAIPGTERSDEIGALARSLHRMGLGLRIAIDRMRNSAKKQRTA